MTGDKIDSSREFNARLNAIGMRIQQPDDTPLFTREPQARMKPMHWKWSDIVGSLDELTSHISLDGGSARRTLKLANPGLEYGTTPTYWVSIQYILPGEVASAHRHTPEAFRFVISGSGCSTTVGGENYDMNEGDLVLTPSWAWHDHTHQGSEPMIWMDVLDISRITPTSCSRSVRPLVGHTPNGAQESCVRLERPHPRAATPSWPTPEPRRRRQSPQRRSYPRTRRTTSSSNTKTRRPAGRPCTRCR
jgi:gentisate 1,2-dioxygenase